MAESQGGVRFAEDDIIAQLLPESRAVNGAYVEEEAEEVKYSDTEEDIGEDEQGRELGELPAEGLAAADRPQAAEAPAGEDCDSAGRHARISWRQWQAPGGGEGGARRERPGSSRSGREKPRRSRRAAEGAPGEPAAREPHANGAVPEGAAGQGAARSRSRDRADERRAREPRRESQWDVRDAPPEERPRRQPLGEAVRCSAAQEPRAGRAAPGVAGGAPLPGSPAQQQQQPPSARRPRSPDLAPRRRGPSPPPPPARRVAVALRAYSPPLPMPPPAGYYARRPRSPSAPEYLGPPPGYERGAPRLVWPAEERLPRTASGDRYYGEAPPLPYGYGAREVSYAPPGWDAPRRLVRVRSPPYDAPRRRSRSPVLPLDYPPPARDREGPPPYYAPARHPYGALPLPPAVYVQRHAYYAADPLLLECSSLPPLRRPDSPLHAYHSVGDDSRGGLPHGTALPGPPLMRADYEIEDDDARGARGGEERHLARGPGPDAPARRQGTLPADEPRSRGHSPGARPSPRARGARRADGVEEAKDGRHELAGGVGAPRRAAEGASGRHRLAAQAGLPNGERRSRDGPVAEQPRPRSRDRHRGAPAAGQAAAAAPARASEDGELREFPPSAGKGAEPEPRRAPDRPHRSRDPAAPEERPRERAASRQEAGPTHTARPTEAHPSKGAAKERGAEPARPTSRKAASALPPDEAPAERAPAGSGRERARPAGEQARAAAPRAADAATPRSEQKAPPPSRRVERSAQPGRAPEQAEQKAEERRHSKHKAPPSSRRVEPRALPVEVPDQAARGEVAGKGTGRDIGFPEDGGRREGRGGAAASGKRPREAEEDRGAKKRREPEQAAAQPPARRRAEPIPSSRQVERVLDTRGSGDSVPSPPPPRARGERGAHAQQNGHHSASKRGAASPGPARTVRISREPAAEPGRGSKGQREAPLPGPPPLPQPPPVPVRSPTGQREAARSPPRQREAPSPAAKPSPGQAAARASRREASPPGSPPRAARASRREAPPPVVSPSRTEPVQAAKPAPVSGGHASPAEPVAEQRSEWYYQDPNGVQQGPCSIGNFRAWLTRMRADAGMAREYEEFLGCLVWRRGMARRLPLRHLLS